MLRRKDACPLNRHILLILLIIGGLLASTAPARAEVESIAPEEELPTVLPEDEAAKLRRLQSAVVPIPWSDVSPDDRDQLAALFRPVGYYRFEKAGHGPGRPDYQFIAGQQQILWFREQLGP